MIKIDKQEQNEMNFRSQVVNIEKVGHSRNGNPKFEITIDDMGQERTFTTRADIPVQGISEGSVIDFNISSNGNQITAVELTEPEKAQEYVQEMNPENSKENIEIEFTDLRDADVGDLIGVEINGEQVDINLSYDGNTVDIHDFGGLGEMAEKHGMDEYEMHDFIKESFENSELRHDIDTELEENIERLEEYGIEYTNTQLSHMVEHGDEYKTFNSAYEAMEYGNEVLEARQELMYEAVQSFEPTDRDNPALTSIEFEEVMHDKGLEGKNPFASHSIDEVKSMSRDELKEASRSEPERETPDLSRKEEPAKEREKVRELER